MKPKIRIFCFQEPFLLNVHNQQSLSVSENLVNR